MDGDDIMKEVIRVFLGLVMLACVGTVVFGMYALYTSVGWWTILLPITLGLAWRLGKVVIK